MAVLSIAYLVFGNRLVFGSVAAVELDSALRASLVSRFDPESMLPLTLVEIDDATAAAPTPQVASWGFTSVTPRDKLAEMLNRIASFAPAAIVVDVDLSDDPAEATQGVRHADEALEQFFKGYTGPSLILVKRSTATHDGQFAIASSHRFDPIVSANARLSWAHAMYATDADGTVRKWAEWFVSCTATGATALPSVPLRVLATWPTDSGSSFPRPSALAYSAPCRPGLTDSRSHVIIYDGALSGRPGATVSRNLSRISAWQVLDPHLRRDDRTLFFGRVVLVGGTRSDSTDLWRTPVGLLPGLELMANTVRFAPGQLRETGHATTYSLALFLFFCALRWLLRPIVAIAMGVGCCAGLLWGLGPYVILDAIQNSIILFAELSIVEETVHLYFDARTHGWRFLVSPDLRGHAT
jgi:CHASE2 domain-containing sensor protein